MVIPTNDRQSKHPESGTLVNRARQRRLDAKNKQLHCSIPEELHEILRTIAFHERTEITALVIKALEKEYGSK